MTKAATATPPSVAWPRTSAPGRSRTPDTRLAIQGVVDRHFRALNTRNLALFNATVDQRNEYWKTVQQEQYRLWSRDYAGSTADARVRSVQPLQDGFYRGSLLLTVRFRSGDYGQVVESWVFRKVGKIWKLSEPTTHDLGPLHGKRGAHVTLEYYDWDGWQADRVLRMSEAVYIRVTTLVGVAAKHNVRVRLLPSYEVSPGYEAGETVGYYRSDTPNVMYLRSPGSYGFGGYSPYDSPYEELRNTMEHELTHLLADRRIPLGNLPDWMTEGLAEWAAGNERQYEVERALDGHHLLSMAALDDFTGLSGDAGLAYGQSYELIGFIVESKGMETYWKLAGAYAATGRLGTSFQRSLGMSKQAFEHRWMSWLRTKYREGGRR